MSTMNGETGETMSEGAQLARDVLTGVGTGWRLRTTEVLATIIRSAVSAEEIRNQARVMDHKASTRVLPLHNTVIRAGLILAAVGDVCSTQEAWCLADWLGSDSEDMLDSSVALAEIHGQLRALVMEEDPAGVDFDS
jgi:NCAIR mutase (PurE)-related protein